MRTLANKGEIPVQLEKLHKLLEAIEPLIGSPHIMSPSTNGPPKTSRKHTTPNNQHKDKNKPRTERFCQRCHEFGGAEGTQN